MAVCSIMDTTRRAGAVAAALLFLCLPLVAAQAADRPAEPTPAQERAADPPENPARTAG